MLARIQQLREIAQRCLNGLPLDNDMARWLGTSLDECLQHRARTIEDAMGLRSSRGGVPWWMEEAIRKRDAALRALADAYFGDQSVTAQASRIYTLAIRYAASTWHYERQRDTMVSQQVGTANEYLWQAFKSGAPMPVGTRHLRNILGH